VRKHVKILVGPGRFSVGSLPALPSELTLIGVHPDSLLEPNAHLKRPQFEEEYSEIASKRVRFPTIIAHHFA
jgi:hypothetical protein